ncbi:ATP-dependent helicase [Spiroplasma endosymbiont of Crioceris asparagi]|uniref:ATP-dependent helicase n=1 Tax=Spiroplasma endosymbiont of Crioceris asparagi TaxID=3066286 RepID=UPI0030D5660A
MIKELLAKLNNDQLEAVLEIKRPLRIVAGAGSGKTRVIATKIAYLIDVEKINPNKILAITFTNKAAKEMKNRVYDYSGFETKNISTFHSLCVRVLREEFAHANLKKDFLILDSSDQVSIVKELIKTNKIDDVKKERAIVSKISHWKNNGTSPESAAKDNFKYADIQIVKIYKLYNQYLNENNYLDFDDLIIKTEKLFSNNKDVVQKWSERYDYILVDEFQDTSLNQYNLVKMLVNNRNNLTVVGDPDQNIYTWRGSKIEIILNFEKNFKNAKTIFLNKNYRSTQPILNIANDLISKNKNREEKSIFSDIKVGEKVLVTGAANKMFEAKYVAKKIAKYVKDGKYNYSDFFIIYRINAWSQNFENELQYNKIPFDVYGGMAFRDRAVVKDMTAILKAVVFGDKNSFKRVFRFIPRVGEKTAEKIFLAASIENLSILDIFLHRFEVVETISKNLKFLRDAFVAATKSMDENKSMVEIAKQLITDLEYAKKFDPKDEEDADSLRYIKSYYDLISSFQEYSNESNTKDMFIEFLQNETLSDSSSKEDTKNKVILSTIHGVKGLEAKCVFVVGVNRGIFPLSKIWREEELEEERRAFYVAITRAKEELEITYVDGDFSYITNEKLQPSQFISQIDKNLYVSQENLTFNSPSEATFFKPQMQSPIPKFQTNKKEPPKTNQKITHINFGEGVVIDIVGNFIKVAFADSKIGIKMVPLNSNSWKIA